MCVRMVYLRSRSRRPVSLGRESGGDLQEALPRWWCDLCGREVFGADRRLCGRCARQRREVREYEEETRQLMPDL